MKKIILTVLTVFTLSGAAVLAGAAQGAEYPDAWMRDHIGDVRSLIVVLKEDAADTKAEWPAELAAAGKLKKLFPETARAKKSAAQKTAAERRLNNMYRAEVSSPAEAATMLKALNRDPRVEYAEPDWPVELFAAPNDTHFDPEQWSLNNTGQTCTTYSGAQESGAPGADINWLAAWQRPDFPSNEIIIAVVDTGVDYTHRDITNRMWRNPGEIPGNGVDDDGNDYIDDWLGIDLVNTDTDPIDDHLHGTHVAGTIAAEINNSYGMAGICPSAKIMPVKIFDSTGGGGLTSHGVAAIRYAANMGAKVINNSWGGGGYSQALQDAITYANERGASVLCAAGNNGNYLAMYPASYDGAVSVGATDSSDGRAYFSNYGPWVDVMAPGHNILSLLSGLVPNPPYGKFDGEFLIISGTSMATPAASGAMGLLMSKRPGHEPWIYEKVMEATCNAGIYALPANADMAAGWMGAGRIDTDSMLSYEAANAFIRSKFDLHMGFGRSFLAPGEATNLIIKVGTWIHDVENLTLSVTALDPDSTLSATGYAIGNLPAGSVTNIPAGTFIAGCTTNAEWNSVKRFRIQLKSGGTVLETRTNQFSVYGGQVGEFCVYDLDGDGIKEIIGAYGSVLSVFGPQGDLKWFHDLGQDWYIIGSPAAGDVDGDGKAEVVFIAERNIVYFAAETMLYVYEHDGTINTSIWPVDLQGADYHLATYYFGSANQAGLMDADGDGDLDIVITATHETTGRCGVIDGHGAELGYAQAVSSNRFSSLPALGDVDGDGANEIVTIEHGTHAGLKRAWLVVRDGLAAARSEIELASGTNQVLYGSYNYAPVPADVDLDGQKEFVIAAAFNGAGYLTVIKPDGSVLDGFPVQVNNTVDYSVPVIADTDGDGRLEMFVYRNDFQQLLGFDSHGRHLPYFPLTDTNMPLQGGYVAGFRPVIGDVDGDGEPEIVYGGSYQVDEDAGDRPYSFRIFARDIKDGLMVPGFPVELEGLDGDSLPRYRIALDAPAGDIFGTNQYIMASAGSKLFVLGTGRPFDPAQQHWPQINRDSRNSYTYEPVFFGDLTGGFSASPRSGVNAYTAQFTGVHRARSTAPVTYRWDFDGDGTNELTGVNLAAPAHSYGAPGLYTVSLTLSNASGEVCTVTRENYIAVYSDLSVDFTHSPSGALTAPIRVDFTDLSQNGPQRWLWDFGDGATSTNQHPQHLYTNAGTFTVTLTVSNDFGSGGGSTGQIVKTDLIQIGTVQSNITVHYVSPDGAGVYPYKTWAEAATNLNDAIAALEPYHSITVTDGVYRTGGWIRNPVHDTAIRSVNGPAVTFLDGGHAYPGISLKGTNCLIEGFTVQNCVGQQAALDLSGPEAGVPAPGTVARNMIIRNNSRLVLGGTVYINGGALTDSLIYSNTCYSAAGAFVINGLISNCVFKFNQADEGSIVSVSGAGVLYGSLVVSNSGWSGVELHTGGNVYSTTIAGNTITTNNGGGLMFDGYSIDNASECFNVISYGNSNGRNVFFDWPSGNPANPKPQKRALIYNCCWAVSVSNQLAAGQVQNEIVGNPLFVNAAAGNCRLQAASPCRDKGRDNASYTNILQEILIDFGTDAHLSTGNWNNVTTTNTGLKIADMTNTAGGASGRSLELLTAFDGSAATGLTNDNAWPYPPEAERDHMHLTTALGETLDLLRISGVQTDTAYDFGFYASHSSIANMRFQVGVSQTDILAAGAAGSSYRFKKLSGLEFGTTQAVVRVTQTGGEYAALGVLHLTEWDPDSYYNVFADQTDLGGNPRLTGPHVDIGAYEWTGSSRPDVRLTASPVTGAAPLSVQFTATAWDDGSITNYAWDFGGGFTTNGAALTAPAHVFNEPGWHAVTVTVTDNDGQTATAQIGILADWPRPAAPFGFSAVNITPSRNDLLWTDASSNETSFILQRRMIANYTGIIMDDSDPGVSFKDAAHDPWVNQNSAGAYGGSYTVRKGYDPGDGIAPSYARYRPELSDEGWYEIYEWHANDSRHSPAARFEVYHKNGLDSGYINQRSGGGQWNRIGMWYLEKGSFLQIYPYGDYDWIAADAFKFVRVEPWQPLTTLAADSESFSDTAGLTDDRMAGYRIASSNQYGLSPWVETQVVIPPTNLSPVAAITSLSVTSGIPDLAVDAAGTGTDADGVITNYVWNFGDGYSGSIQSGATATNARYVYRYTGEYAVTLTVYDDQGYFSAATGAVRVYNAVPNTPENLAAVPVDGSHVRITWDDKAFGEERYVLHRQANGGTFGQLAALGESVEEYNDTAVTNGALYGYRVRAESAFGTSEWSNVDSAFFGNPADFTLPFTETFENDPAMAGQAGPLDGQHGWISTGAAVTNSDAQGGSQSCRIAQGQARHLFTGGQTNVLAVLRIKPVFGSEPATVPENATAVFYVNTNGNVVAYSNTTAIVIADFRLLIADWNNVEIESDYVAKTWKMALNGTNLFGNFAFYSVERNGFGELLVVSESADGAFVDTLVVTTASDRDADGLPDDWEIEHFGNLNADPGDPSANGINTVLECWIADLDPTDPDAVFTLSNVRNVLGWNATSGRVYTIYWTSNLLSGFDLLHSNYTGGVFTDTVHAADGQGFYKIEMKME